MKDRKATPLQLTAQSNGGSPVLIAGYHGGWDFLEVPWLAGMVVLFAFEFIEGNTSTITLLISFAVGPQASGSFVE